jgi:hypothetical protein
VRAGGAAGGRGLGSHAGREAGGRKQNCGESPEAGAGGAGAAAGMLGVWPRRTCSLVQTGGLGREQVRE